MNIKKNKGKKLRVWVKRDAEIRKSIICIVKYPDKQTITTKYDKINQIKSTLLKKSEKKSISWTTSLYFYNFIDQNHHRITKQEALINQLEKYKAIPTFQLS